MYKFKTHRMRMTDNGAYLWTTLCGLPLFPYGWSQPRPYVKRAKPQCKRCQRSMKVA